MKLFELFATLALDTSEFDTGVKAAKESAESLGSSVETNVISKGVAMGNAMYDAAKTTASAMWNLGQSVVSAAADIEAENAQFAETFSGIETEANASFSSIAADTNILAGRLRSVGMQAFSQFKGAGMDASKALTTMDEYTRLAADAAAYYNISLEDADTKMRSFLRGNVEAGDAIGLFTSAIQRDSKGMEMYGLKWEKLNEEQRQLVMLDIASEIYEQSGAMGQAARESESYSNVTGNLQRAWKEVLSTLGGPVLKSVTPAIQKLSEFLQQNPEIIERIGEVLGDIADAAASSLISGLEWMSENGDTILAIFNGLLNTINNIIAALTGKYQTQLDVTAQVTLDTMSNVTQSTGNSVLGAIAGGAVQSSMSADSPFGTFGAGIGSLISNFFKPKAIGMDYVPYDEYPALLHEGEAVLTKAEAEEWRKSPMPAGYEIDYDRLAAAVAVALSGVSVNMDGVAVGRLTAPTVSREIYTATNARRYG